MMDPSKIVVLNGQDEPDKAEKICSANEVVELSKHLYRQLLKLKGSFLQEDGRVAYPNLREAPEYLTFKKDSEKLRHVDLAGLNEEERKAVFINIYNTLTIHALAEVVKDEKTMLQLEYFWQKYAYNIGGLIFSLDGVEHGILRCNKVHPTYKDNIFKDDQRKSFVQLELDPRIHFALNCGAKSCPPIRLFSAENLNNALDVAARNFCQNDIIINAEKKSVTASKILMWYGKDFGEDDAAIIDRLTQYLNPEQQEELKKIGPVTLRFADYDWSIH